MARFSTNDAVNVARAYYGLNTQASLLPGYQDQNFLLNLADGTRYVLKIIHPDTEHQFTEMQVALLNHLEAYAPQLNSPRIKPTIAGRSIAHVTHPNGNRHPTLLLTFCHGTFYVDAKPQNHMLHRSLGRFMGQLDRALQNFQHPGMDRSLIWDVSRADSMRAYLDAISQPQRLELVNFHLTRFENEVLPHIHFLRRSLIHNDANDYNLLVKICGFEAARVDGIIDFGDAVQAPIINELAIACAYAILHQDDILEVIAQVTAGYHQEYPLEDRELELILPLIAARLCISVVMSARQAKLDPNNEYLTVSEAPAWRALQQLRELDPKRSLYHIRLACGLEPVAHAAALRHWLGSQKFHPIVQPDPAQVTPLLIPLSQGSPYAGEVGFERVAAFSQIIEDAIKQANAEVGLGFYDEERLCYNSPHFKPDGEEARSIHLGIDVFLPAESPVCAPLDGVVHSFANNANELDYGPTIVLEHQLANSNLSFFTLYGHLSPESLHGMEKGLRISAGFEFARIGAPPHNGGWPPHLHFQVILDMLNFEGDYPGAAKRGERRLWTNLCPDPNLILQIPALQAPAQSNAQQLQQLRQQSIAPSLSLHYKTPLHIVSGEGVYLFDQQGRAYIDMTNNVAHVGHCHPRVNAAMQRQAAQLNTNTRYLHAHLVQYAREICATLPNPLDTCFFVNSGSEANDLAWRLARTYTHGNGAVVIESGYHGHTTALMGLSHYKFANQGKGRAPKHVRVVPLPDTFRGQHAKAADPAKAYAAHVAAGFRDLVDNKIRPAAFWAESIIGCGGQVVPPCGYLEQAATIAREHKALFIADEVQVGFGRVGDAFWGFQQDQVVPDIVTMGKPIGNGHPLAAVVTTRAIAQHFHNGVEYFNTFGGNPVSCAVGLEVLHIIQEEQLQSHALSCGNHLMDGLRQLAKQHNLCADVRGRGLFIGFEILESDAQSPATTKVKTIQEAMKDAGFLLGVDGPDNNVLKIKPPLAFKQQHADAALTALDQILGKQSSV